MLFPVLQGFCPACFSRLCFNKNRLAGAIATIASLAGFYTEKGKLRFADFRLRIGAVNPQSAIRNPQFVFA
jgi:hypothetical protein